MISDTEGWSNRQLNERIQELEANLSLTEEDFQNIERWLQVAGVLIRDRIGSPWSGSELATYNKLCGLMWEVKE